MSDFTGFIFNTGNGTFTSESLGITRVSEGDRYKDSLVPEIEDKTVEIPGLDGAYFYGSNFKTRTISLSIAFDEVTEKQLRDMRQVFGYKHTGELIFNERPYKKYLVKVAQPPELEYVCFDERERVEGAERDGIRFINEESTITTINTDTNEETTHIVTTRQREKVTPWEYTDNIRRIYKGEGTIEFIAYYPFAKAVSKFANEYTNDNIDEWLGTSGLETEEWFTQHSIDKFVLISAQLSSDLNENTGENENSGENEETLEENSEEISEEDTGAINVYNPGDVETGFRLYIPFDNNAIPAFTLTYNDHVLNIADITKKEEDTVIDENNVEHGSSGVQINTVNGLIEGVWKKTNEPGINDSLITSGQIYNEYATGEFFKIQPNVGVQQIDVSVNLGQEVEIYYDYLYF